jgi:hypothetical protein
MCLRGHHTTTVGVRVQGVRQQDPKIRYSCTRMQVTWRTRWAVWAAAKGPHPCMPTRAVVNVRRAHAVCSCPRSCEMAMLHLVGGDGPSLHTQPMLRMPICETTAYLRASWSLGPLPPLGLRRTRGADPLRER